MKKSMHTNPVTEGPLFINIITFFIPIFMGSLLQQSYNFIDALIIGRYTGPEGLAAIDATYNYSKLLVNVFLSIALGGSILIAQYIGAKKHDHVKSIVQSSMMLAIIGGGIMTVVGIILTPYFCRLMKVPDAIFTMSANYLRIYLLGTTFSFLFNIGSGIMKAAGDTKRPFFYLMFSSILNIILDILFISIFRLGVEGAAAATVISQLLSSLLIISHLIKRLDAIRLDLNKLYASIKSLKELLKIGLPLGGQTSLFVISNMMMQRGINAFGVVGIAAWSICGKMDFIIWLCVDAIGITVTTFVAQNYGALNIKRMKGSLKYGFVFAIGTIGIISSLLYVFVPMIAGLFTSDTAVIDMTIKMMRIIAPLYILPAFSQVFSGFLKGIGQTLIPMVLTLISSCGIRIFWVLLILPKEGHILAAIYGYPVSWFASVLLFSLVSLRYKNMGFKVKVS